MVQERMPNFEIPAEMRQMAEQSVEQAKKAFDGFIAAAQQAVSNFEGQAAATQTGAKDVGKRAMAFAEQNIASSFEFAQKLARAGGLDQVFLGSTSLACSDVIATRGWLAAGKSPHAPDDAPNRAQILRAHLTPAVFDRRSGIEGRG